MDTKKSSDPSTTSNHYSELYKIWFSKQSPLIQQQILMMMKERNKQQPPARQASMTKSAPSPAVSGAEKQSVGDPDKPVDPKRQKAVIAELDKALDDLIRDSAKDIVNQLTAFIKWNETLSDIQREKLQGLILVIADLPNKHLDYTDAKQVLEPLARSLAMLEDCQREILNVYREAGFKVPTKDQIADVVGSRLYDYLPSRWNKTIARSKLGVGPVINGTMMAYPPHGGVVDMSAYNTQMNSIVESLLAAEVDSRAIMLLAKGKTTSLQSEGKAKIGAVQHRGSGKSDRKAGVIQRIVSQKKKDAKGTRKSRKKAEAVVRKPTRNQATANEILICLDVKGSRKISRSRGKKAVSDLMRYLIKKLKSYHVLPKKYKWVKGDCLMVNCKPGIARNFLSYLTRGFDVSGYHFDINNFRVFLYQGVYNLHEYEPYLDGIDKLLKKYQYIIIRETRHLFGDKLLAKLFPHWNDAVLWNEEWVSWGEGKSKSEMAKVFKRSRPLKRDGGVKKRITNMRNISLEDPALTSSGFSILSGKSGSFAHRPEGPWQKPVICNPIHRVWKKAQRSIQGARWVWIKEKPTDEEAKEGQIVWHRLSFSVAQAMIEIATLILCVDDFVNLNVNGRFIRRIGMSEGVVSVDITTYLHVEDNNIFMEIENSPQTNGTGLSNPSGIIYRLNVK